MEAVTKFLAKDSVKITMFFISLIAGGVAVVYPPPTTIGKVATAVVSLLAGLGITSGGTSGLRSNVSQAQTVALQEKGIVSPNR